MLPVSLQPLNNYHNGNENEQWNIIYPRFKPRHAQQARLKNPAHVFPRLPDALGAEDYPADDDKRERQQHPGKFPERGQKPPFRHDIGVFPIFPEQNQRQEKQCVVRTPCDERPVGAVPEPAHQEDYERVAYHFRLRDAASAERDVDIVAEPCRQRDVPPAPELRNVAREIRHVEVAHQTHAEQLGCADGDVRVARKVAVNLESEENGGEQ